MPEEVYCIYRLHLSKVKRNSEHKILKSVIEIKCKYENLNWSVYYVCHGILSYTFMFTINITGDTPKLRSENVSFALTVILNILCPPARMPQQHQQNSSSKSTIHHLSFTENHRCSSFSQSDKIHRPENQLLLSVAYLGILC